MPKIKKIEENINTSAWLVLFTNLMILLLAFFIVLVAMGNVDSKKKRLALNSLFGSFGFHPGGRSAIGKSSGTDITIAGPPLSKQDIDLEQLRNIAIANGFGSDAEIKMEIEKIGYIRISQ